MKVFKHQTLTNVYGSNPSPSSVIESVSDQQTSTLSAFRLAQKTMHEPHPVNATSMAPPMSNASPLTDQASLHQSPWQYTHQSRVNPVEQGRTESESTFASPPFPQAGFPKFDLNDFENFFGWDAGSAFGNLGSLGMPPQTQ